MKWSVQLNYKRLLSAYVSTLTFWFYLYFVGVVLLFAPYGDGVVTLVMYSILIASAIVGAYCLTVYMLLRRMNRLSGNKIQRYELTREVLKVSSGRDMLSLPTEDLFIWKQTKDVLILRRRKTWIGTVILMFDDQATLERAKAMLPAKPQKQNNWLNAHQ